jgi:hypothetical protein
MYLVKFSRDFLALFSVPPRKNFQTVLENFENLTQKFGGHHFLNEIDQNT